ncbi:hypothetical protein [Roseomonas sp. 18066]|uniref:hypothetical protein n=1 Tax=Roseomonas sp. 18066 TaxID=2681412 RepID=UPI00135785D5|nr:hypothetical protein [Roseomonas sp. 18066]
MILRIFLFLIVLAAWIWQAHLPAPIPAIPPAALLGLALLLAAWAGWKAWRKLRGAIRDMDD